MSDEAKTAPPTPLFQPTTEGMMNSFIGVFDGMDDLAYWLNEVSTEVWTDAEPGSSPFRRFMRLRRKIVERLDQDAAEFIGNKANGIACRKGCSACCHTLTEITVLDAMELAQELKARRTPEEITALRKKTEELGAAVAELSREEKFIQRIACPLLDDNLCTVYEARPVVCRSYFSTDLEICETGVPGSTRLDWGLNILMNDMSKAMEVSHLFAIGEISALLTIALAPGTSEAMERDENPFEHVAQPE